MHIAKTCIYCGSHGLVKSPAIVAPFVAHRALGYAPTEITEDWGLRDIGRGVAHARCNTVMCQECHGLFMDLRFGDEEMNALYADYRGEEYTALRDQYEPGYRQRNEGLNVLSHRAAVETLLHDQVAESPRILDWGGDDGRNTPFREAASLCHVVDISGKETIPGVSAISPEAALSGDYDLIILSHILEHIPEPKSLLDSLLPLIRRGSKLYIELPFEKTMQKLGEQPPELRQPNIKRHWHEHINFYSPAALTQLVERSGLSVLLQTKRIDSQESTVLCLLCEFSPA